ncbi:MAG: hypothetical protein RR266_03745 [Bacilli bacterium]
MIFKNKKIIITISSLFGVLLIAGIILACFSMYEVLICTLITFPFGLVAIYSIDQSTKGLVNVNLLKAVSFTLLRYLMMLLGILVPALIIHFTKQNDFYILISALIMTVFYISTVFVNDDNVTSSVDGSQNEQIKNDNVIDVEVIDSKEEK